MTPEELAVTVGKIEFRVLQSLGFLRGVKPDDFLADQGTAVYDATGVLLFERFPVVGARAYADIAINPAMGAPLLSVTSGELWDESSLISLIRAHAQEYGIPVPSEDPQFVAYSYPRVGLRFATSWRDHNALVLDWKDLRVISSDSGQNVKTIPLLEQLSYWEYVRSKGVANLLRQKYQRRQQKWLSLFSGDLSAFVSEARISAKISEFVNNAQRVIAKIDGVSAPCQLTSLWCVPACVQGLLAFGGATALDQHGIAGKLDLGTTSNPIAFPLDKCDELAQALVDLAAGSLAVTKTHFPVWIDFVNSIDSKAPILNLVAGHARVVFGYGYASYGSIEFEVVYLCNPWCCDPKKHDPATCNIEEEMETFNPSNYKANLSVRRI